MKGIKIMVLGLLFWSRGMVAQTFEDPKIEISYGFIAKAYQDSIVLRWAPKNIASLPAHIEGGVHIDMLVVKGKFSYKYDKWQRITKEPIKPLPLESFRNEKSKPNEHEMLVAQLLYGNISSNKKNTLIGANPDEAAMLDGLFSMALIACDFSPSAADKMGLRYAINNSFNENEKIFFRIYSAFSHPNFKTDTAQTFVTYEDLKVDNTPKFLTARPQEKNVDLIWPVNRDLYSWSGFYIERSTDGKNFERLNKKPYTIINDARKLNFVYRDSVANYIPYFYRIQAIDPFGDLTDYSETVKSFGRDLTPPTEVSLIEINNNNNSIELQWKFMQPNSNSDLKHFVIKKGNAIDFIKDTIKIVSKNTFNYTDFTSAKTKSIYYEVVAVDTAGNYSSSNPIRYFMPDTDPPKPPQEFTASIDTNGIVHLKWIGDSEDELMGYRVYRANQIDHKFVCLQEGYLNALEYFDTLSLKSLTKEVYYSVAAIDLSYNHSAKCDPIKLIKPNKISPFPPSIINYKLSDAGVTFDIQASPSEDVLYYYIKRINVLTNKLEMEKKVEKQTLHFVDKDLQNGILYQYIIIAEDQSKLLSEPSFPLEIKAYASNKHDDIKLAWMENKGYIGFTINKKMDNALYYIVYIDTGEGFRQYESTSLEKLSYIDSKTKAGTHEKIRYGVQAQFFNQSKSEILSLNWKYK